jgi:hypothetical protein
MHFLGFYRLPFGWYGIDLNTYQAVFMEFLWILWVIKKERLRFLGKRFRLQYLTYLTCPEKFAISRQKI